MTIDAAYLYESLLRWNYFPNQKRQSDEVPPIFTSSKFLPGIADKLLSEKLRKDGYDQVEYFATRHNNVSRPLSIPHPAPYVKLVKSICDNWSNLDYICENQNSRIFPQEHADGRAVVMDYEDPYVKLDWINNEAFGKKFRVHTDITNCFPSIYTHAIPWAVVGFDHAKKHKGQKHSKEWFNELDFYQRMLKRNETLGVAIGPGTSNILVEAILARIDEELCKKYLYYRYIDDYTCYCDTYEQAQEFLRELNDMLRTYKLALNLKKTEVLELPVPLDPDWIIELSTRMPTGIPNAPPKEGRYFNATEAIRYFEYALQLKQRTPDGSVLKFAVKSIIYRLDGYAVRPVLEFLLNLSRFYPLLLPLLDHLLENKYVISINYEKQFNAILSDNAINRRSDGMCWALYFMIKNKIEICDDAASKVFESKDCMALVLIYLSGKFEEKVLAFANSIDKTDCYELDRYWLLLYQLFFDGKITNPYSGESTFEILKADGVSFLEPRVVAS